MAQRARDFTPSLRFPTQLVSQQAASIERGIAGLFGGAVRGAEQGMARKESRRRDDADRARQAARDIETDRHRGVLESNAQKRIELEAERVSIQKTKLENERLTAADTATKDLADAQDTLRLLQSMPTGSVDNEIAKVQGEIDRMSRGLPGLLDAIQRSAMEDTDPIPQVAKHPETQTAAALEGDLAEARLNLALSKSQTGNKHRPTALQAKDNVFKLTKKIGNLTEQVKKAQEFEASHKKSEERRAAADKKVRENAAVFEAVNERIDEFADDLSGRDIARIQRLVRKGIKGGATLKQALDTADAELLRLQGVDDGTGYDRMRHARSMAPRLPADRRAQFLAEVEANGPGTTDSDVRSAFSSAGGDVEDQKRDERRAEADERREEGKEDSKEEKSVSNVEAGIKLFIKKTNVISKMKPERFEKMLDFLAPADIQSVAEQIQENPAAFSDRVKETIEKLIELQEIRAAGGE